MTIYRILVRIDAPDQYIADKVRDAINEYLADMPSELADIQSVDEPVRE